MAVSTLSNFDVSAFSKRAGRRMVFVRAPQAFFTQGNPADFLFLLQSGRAKLTATSASGKEATIAFLSGGDFVGQEAIAEVRAPHTTTATATTACYALKIERAEAIRFLHEDRAFADFFLEFLLARGIRAQADLIDQLFNSSEKRLARILLLMAKFGQPGEQEALIPKISQETLAAMVGTTRPRVNFFMNRFRRLGFIQYDGEIRVHPSLLNVVLRD